MEDRLAAIAERFRLIETEMGQPEVVADQQRFRALNRERLQLEPVVETFHRWQKAKAELEDTTQLQRQEDDQAMREMLADEKAQLEEEIDDLRQKLVVLLLPRDPNSGRDVMMEIRAGTGGEEAALFVMDLYRMYVRYADLKGWKTELIEKNQTEIGGMKEVTFSISGADAFDSLKFESGVHRVQRVPETEAGGRIHTSAVTVAVMPEAEENDVEIRNEDLRIDVYRSSGHGGQSVNTTDSAVRITHIPTGMVVTCQDEKSQLKNKLKAMRVLRSRLYEIAERERLAEEASRRRSQVGSGDRSERIRTYNFPQSRLTDHRIGLTLYNLETVLNGELDGVVQPLQQHEAQEQLSGGEA